MEKDLRERAQEMRRLDRERQEKDQMRMLLSKQMEEKKNRESHTKNHHDE